jgi:hypothetical protein
MIIIKGDYIMCITNNFSEETLKQIRKVETNSQEMNDRELAEALVRIKTIQESLEWGQEKIVKILKKRGFNSIEMFPEFESKVYLAEGRTSSTYNIEKIANELPVQTFVKCVNIVKSKVDALEDEVVSSIIDNNKFTIISEPSIAVRKMSKKELKENS